MRVIVLGSAMCFDQVELRLVFMYQYYYKPMILSPGSSVLARDAKPSNCLVHHT